MKIVREHINEKFEADSDPISDMNIGTHQLIINWIENIRKNHNGGYDPFYNYKINDDLTIDVFEKSFIPDNFGNLPTFIQFGVCHDTFVLSDCNLTTLKGAPYIVKGDFFCSNNQLISLKYAPQKVDKDFYCGHNPGNFTEEDIRKVCKVGGKVLILTY